MPVVNTRSPTTSGVACGPAPKLKSSCRDGYACSQIVSPVRASSAVTTSSFFHGPSLARPLQQQTAAAVQIWQEYGGLAGRFALALLVLAIVSRRRLLRVFQIPGLFVVPLVFWFAPGSDLTTLKVGMFFAGLFTVAQFSFWGNYLPRMYPTHLRGTGEAFAANVGGRMIGTSFAYVTTQLATYLSGAAHVKLAMAAAMVGAFVYVAGVILSTQLPEPASEKLPE